MKKTTVFLQNKDRPDLGWVEIHLPADEGYLNRKLAEIAVPYANPERNCVYSKQHPDGTPFDHIKDELVNADEWNYLATRLDSFDGHEMVQFQAAAHCENITGVKGLITSALLMAFIKSNSSFS